jgi:alpha-tubulin suppressor-like RCC1 family protein
VISSNDIIQYLPIRINEGEIIDKKITYILASFAYSLALVDSGEIFSWGSNNYGLKNIIFFFV